MAVVVAMTDSMEAFEIRPLAVPLPGSTFGLPSWRPRRSGDGDGGAKSHDCGAPGASGPANACAHFAPRTTLTAR